ncbi:hypothetical protein FRC10_009118 [Ceratobasidium sp. 414]|nr:hypothetical protein FRC10_009118 [Ceratobasidium sp. 414]
MSLARSFFNDFRPLFRLIEDPFFSSHPYALTRSARPESWQTFRFQRQAAVELSEDGNNIVVQAEVPGVQKENLDVHLGNDGQSLTIEGRVHRVNKASRPAPAAAEQTTENAATDVVKSNAESVPAESEYRSSFSQTVWLPQPVDGKKATAELADGVLTLTIPKREQVAAERITIN